jgi:DNA-directed RNA polymerase specialized sigma24 family protein
VQDTYVVLVRRWQKSGTVDPEAYVRRILYSRFIDGWRRRRLLELPSASPPDAPGGDEAGTATDRLTFRDALELLTPRQRGWLIWPRGISDGGPSNDERRPTPCRRRCHLATS